MKYCDTKFWVLLLVISTNVNMLFAQLQNNEDQCEGGTSFSSSVYNGSFSSNAAFDNVIGDNSWTTLGKNTSTQEWIAYKFPVSYRINKVRMHSRENFTALGMTNFSIQGSNTSSNGEDGDWVTLISGLNMSPTLFAWNEFSFANNGYYSMYRVIGATSLLGDAGYYIAVSEIEMMGYAQDDVVETQIWSYGTNNSIFYSGNVGIGTNKTENFALSVNGKIRASDIIKIYPKDQWPDFVFENTYKLTPLSEVKEFIESNGHLSGVPSAEKVQKEGVELGEMNSKLLQKIEELTLYLIRSDERVQNMEKEMQDIKRQNAELKKEMTKLKTNKK